MLPIRIIVHPTDFSASAENAFWMAAALARDYGAVLKVVHVTSEPVLGFAQGIIPPDPLRQEQEVREQLHQYASKEKGLVVEECLLIGNAAQEIVRFATEEEADLIIMGTHGWTGLNRLVMGSVASHVARKAKCPVLTLRMPFAEEAKILPEFEPLDVVTA
jgi:nucleotide-binding universal stress UspA family protein